MNARTLVLLGIVLVAALARLVPHPPNFTPIGALALFGAAHFRSRWSAFLVPLASLLVSDLALEVTGRLGLLSGWLAQGKGLHATMWIVYGTFAVCTAVGLLLRRRQTLSTVTAAVLATSVLFFLLTNFGVWLVGTVAYPQTFAGLLLCYEAALPFFRNTLLGDLFFATVLFGGFALAEKRYPALQVHPV